MSIRQRNAHFTDWAAVCKALHVNTESEARTALESSDNTFYYYVCYIKSTKEIYTHGQIYSCSGNDDLLDLINELTTEVVENEEVTARALSELSENKASRGEVEMFELSKQDRIDDLDSIRTKANNAVQPDQISNFVSANDVAKVATSGSYNDLTNKPTIPAAVTESTVSGWGFTKNIGTITNITINGNNFTPEDGIVDLGLVTRHVPMIVNSFTTVPATVSVFVNQKYVYTDVINRNSTFNIIVSNLDTSKDNTWCLSFKTGTTVPTISFGISSSGYTIMWANGVTPTFETNAFYEITFKLVGTCLLGVCGAFKAV